MNKDTSREKFAEQEKFLIEKMIENKMWKYVYMELHIFWNTLQKHDEEWLVGENGIIYRLPSDIWHRLVTEIADRKPGDGLSETAKGKILSRMKEDRKHQIAKEKEQRKTGKLSARDREAINKKLGFSNNSVFADKRSTMAGNDPHGYFSSNY